MKKKYTKSKKYKKKKSILKNRFFFYFLLIIFCIFFFYYFFIFSNVFQVKNIEVKGEQFNREQDILSVIEPFLEKKIIFITNSIFLINKTYIKNALLDTFLSIESIEVSKIFPRKISINIKEREAKVIGQYQDKEYLIDEQGLVFRLKEKEYQLPLFVFDEQIHLKDEVLSKTLIKQIVNINKSLEPDYLIYEGEDVAAIIGNTKFIFDMQKSITQQIEDLFLLLERHELKIENLEYVDLRFDKIFYREL